jgi:hypothetical protein
MPPNRPEPPHLEPAPEAFDTLLESATRRLCGRASSDEFLSWFQQTAPRIASAAFPDGMAPDLVSRAAYWLGVSLWNSFPRPDNRYRPRPLPRPERNAPCPCGSGRKFKHCCVGTIGELAMDDDWAWPLLFEALPARHWVEEAAQGRLPIEVKLMAVQYFRDAGRWKTVVGLVERELLEGDATLDPRLGDAVDPLCDAYDALYRTDRKKIALLRRLSQHPVGHIRAEASQRLGAWLADEGDTEGAWSALREAMRADPDNPGAALLELTLLHAHGNPDQLQRRAEFWSRRFERRSDVSDELKDLLAAARQNPSTAFDEIESAHVDPLLMSLVACVDAAVGRPVPVYTWQSLGAGNPDLGDSPCELVEDAASAAAARGWRAVCPIDKPFSTEWLPAEATAAWDTPGTWLDYVEAHAEVFDSVDVVDDLVSIVLAHDDADVTVVMRRGVQAMLDRSAAIVDAAQRDVPASSTLPWIVAANRPALRLLSRRAALCDDAAARIAHMERCLALNPHDNHGWRGPLVNMLLQLNRDADALALTERYAGDRIVDLLYGTALALFRLGEKGRATVALDNARARAPRVFAAILRETMRPPSRLREGYVTYGGDDEAWWYREAMRAEWLRTPGVIDLMRLLPSRR